MCTEFRSWRANCSNSLAPERRILHYITPRASDYPACESIKVHGYHTKWKVRIPTCPLELILHLSPQSLDFAYRYAIFFMRGGGGESQFIPTFRFRVKCNRTNFCSQSENSSPTESFQWQTIQYNRMTPIPTVHWIGWQSSEMHLQWDYIRLPTPPTFRRDHAFNGHSLPTTSSKGVQLFISVSPSDVRDVILLEDVTTHSLPDWTKHLRFSLTFWRRNYFFNFSTLCI
jgi:hypothetical protein